MLSVILMFGNQINKINNRVKSFIIHKVKIKDLHHLRAMEYFWILQSPAHIFSIIPGQSLLLEDLVPER